MDANPYAPPVAPLDRPPVPMPAAPAMWNPDAAGAWSLLLTPIFGSTLVWRNWTALGERSRAQMALLWLAVSVVALVIAVLILPALQLPYIILWYFACQRPQTQFIKARWGNDYPRRPWLVPILGAVGGLLVFSFVLGFLTAV
jgi:hypothetical protein